MEEIEESHLHICYSSPAYTPGILLLGIAVFLLMVIAAFRCRCPGSLLMLMPVAMAPLLLGILGTFSELQNDLRVYDNAMVRASTHELAVNGIFCLQPIYLSLVVCLPSYVLVAVVVYVRVLRSERFDPIIKSCHAE